ncbi:metal ABC transporter ATP-binding protein [Dolosicoccus paucivorans]|uniref:metal ABC transporter ATP-binding protein n=1 Tax=Dolosicoccus paucivorans TaxID=84521 RepID=UPI0008816D4A|nr:metal ABC transporter ATP-binding protein [Dolosicoccus paucivorans]SDI94571.1 manganese/zinc/iron transport system ATP-binding protein [Dolosicoccus paucivorans]
MKNSLIQVRDLTMAYDEKPVLWDVDLDIPKNARVAIIGPNGAGKSTLMKGILGLEPLLSGRISINHQPVKSFMKQIAYIPQTSSVNWNFPTTVEDVVLMGRYGHRGWIKRPNKEDKRIAYEALDEIGLMDFRHRQISQLSGGQRQRVFIARAIAQQAQIYFMDEPLAGVDKPTEQIIFDFLIRSQNEGKTSIVVHHDLNTLPSYFDYVIILNKYLIASGPMPTTLTREHLEKAHMLSANFQFLKEVL